MHAMRRSVVKLLGLLFAVPLLAVLGMAGLQLQQSVTALATARDSRSVAELDRMLFALAQAQRSPTSFIQTAMLTEDNPKPRIEAMLREVDATTRQTLEAVARQADPTLAAPLRALQEALAKVAPQMPVLETLYARPRAERDVRTLAALSQAQRNVGDAVNDLSQMVSARMRMTGPLAAELVMVRQQAWEMRSGFGQQCSLLRPFIATSRPLDATAQAEWARVRQIANSGREALEGLLARPGASPALRQALGAGISQMDQASGVIRDAVARLDGSNRPVMPASDWTHQCNAPFAAIVAIGTAALDEAVANAEAQEEVAWHGMLAAGTMLALTLALSLLAMLVLLRRLARPVGALNLAVGRLVAGDLATPVPLPRQPDELRSMAEALEALREGAARAEALRAERASQEKAQLERAESVARLCRGFEAGVAGALQDLGGAGARLQGAAGEMRDQAGRSGEQATSAASSAETALGSVNTVAAATEQLGASIREITVRVQGSAQEARQVSAEAERTEGVVQELAGAADRIGEVVGLIRRIAGQTNLLALNATIEAARAGEAGKGFAVVASEVKSLAVETAKATDGIAALVHEIGTATQAAVQATRSIAQGIMGIDGSASAIAAAVEQQSAATQEIARSVQLAATSTQQVTGTISLVANDSQRTGLAADTVFTAVQEVDGVARTLRVQVERFLEQVRSA
ncbi:methyl-accepting chemotaxis protein [Falsiroseomonas tokyonensis]|uniref:Methyl-accepting chemotaxis protein n=1 Tax=Falsiroseomonas tokyonensis TaxID=430521 RepID=A0ABV7BWZ2_9PROT|nr:HAMP domain-containing methyl-accepting chemotaxis protein [Falsiroseomonas tokyonensis]MBU8540048.1 HAMP domain-containing protein [Falsiroseomonas tokyonensis]